LKTKLLFILAGIFYPVILLAENPKPDSIQIISLKEVCVYSTRNSYFNDDNKVSSIDTSTLQRMQSASLSELLQQSTPFSIKSYGTAGLMSTLSFRGTSPTHTQVNWNGFPINSVSTGEMDLSLVNVDFADQIQIVHGASGALYGSGTFGGALDLNNKPDWDNTLYCSLNTELGSFGNKRHALKTKVGNKQVQYQVQGFISEALNNYTYRDIESFNKPKLTQNHSAFSSFGVLQSLSIKLNNTNQFDVGVWWQQNDKEIPAILGRTQFSAQQQKDSTLKTFLKFNKTFSNSFVSLKTAYIYDFLHYTDTTTLTDSHFNTKRWFNEVDYRLYASKIITLETGASYSLVNANIDSYGKMVTDNSFAAFSALKVSFKSITSNFSIRKEYYKTANPPLQLSLGSVYKPIGNKITIRYNISTRYRYPTLNERYWKPGGNPNIHSEKGWGSSFGTDVKVFNNSTSKGWVNATVFSNNINDWIQWSASNDTFAVHNYKKVWSRGMEYGIDQKLSISSLVLTCNIKYNYTLSTNTETYDDNSGLLNKQLLYVPKHTGNITLGALLFKRVDISYSSVYRGSCSTDNVNGTMPAVWLSNVYFSTWTDFWGTRFRFNFKVLNLYNKQYQLIKNYAMPGRAVYFGVNILFNKNNH
jgi:vitamin B12 transporter